MRKKVHADFYEKCKKAIEDVGRDNCIDWRVCAEFESFARVSAFAGELIPNASNYYFPKPTHLLGIPIKYNSRVVSGIELHSKTNPKIMIEIPEWRNVDGIIRLPK